jgi:hypothetical protein
MKRTIFGVICLGIAMAAGVAGQERMTFTGTAVIYGSGLNTRTVTRSFTLRIDGTTSDQDVTRYLSILQDKGQDGLRNAIHNNNRGRFSLSGNIGSELEAVRIDDVDGKRRVRAVFERWQGFGELRGGYRSLDYPFGYVELLFDPRTGDGEGTFIPAAQIRFRSKNGNSQVEIEDFGTFPGRLMGVKMRAGKP